MSAKWAKADIGQVAVTNRDFMSTRPKGASEFAFWSGVSVKDRRVIMKGTLQTDLANGRTTYTEESFIGQKSLGKVVKTCTAGKSDHF